MGVEVLAIAGAIGSIAGGAMQASAARKQSEREARALAAEGEIATRNKAREVNLKTSAQRVSFLNSGFTLEGTPMNILEDTFRVGMEDVTQLRSNYQTAASNVLKSGRARAQSSMLGGIVQAASFGAMGFKGAPSTSMGSDIFGTASTAPIIGNMSPSSPGLFSRAMSFFE